MPNVMVKKENSEKNCWKTKDCLRVSTGTCVIGQNLERQGKSGLSSLMSEGSDFSREVKFQLTLIKSKRDG